MKTFLAFLVFVGVNCGFFDSIYPDCGPQQKFLVTTAFCYCPIDPDYYNKVNLSLQSIFGQEEVVRLVLEKLRLHNFENTAKHPTALHFAGDNGVGKTLVSRKIADAIYTKKNQDMPTGLLYIRGNMYRGASSGAVTEYHRTKLRNQVFQHLQSCPRGLIVIDEVELISPDIIAVFQEFLDSTHPYLVLEDKQVKLSQAIYIFISDFASEGRTEGMALNEIINLVHADSLLKWQDPKQTALIPCIIPFTTLSEKGLQDYVNYLLRSLEEHSKIVAYPFKTHFSISTSSRSKLFMLIKQLYKERRHRYTNYRGIEEIFDSVVLSKILTDLAQVETGKEGEISATLVVDEAVRLIIVEIKSSKKDL